MNMPMPGLIPPWDRVKKSKSIETASDSYESSKAQIEKEKWRMN